MVVDFEKSPESWEQNKKEIVSLLDAGKTVAFLTLGDPMFYSTYIYIFRLLESCGHEIETVPGVPAFCAIGSKLGYPLVEGNDVLSIVPATADEEKIKNVMQATDNVVMMKVYKNFSQMVDLLEENKLTGNAVMISRCGLDDEKHIKDLASAKHEKLNYLSTILARRR
jgi:precorrin-2/cobalt-factor-2 C20-methyltransferase